tara:strand:+ start:97171 stop:97581 length:411 start_codon:yes stop_codon:yes gene_type:complete
VAAIAGALGVIIGAFGAHGLEDTIRRVGFYDNDALTAELIEKRLDQFDVAARYHLAHAVALLALAGVSIGKPQRRILAMWLFTAGIALFSGSLYLLVLTNTPWLGAITPLGGLAWIAAWLSLLSVSVGNGGNDPET